MEEEAKKCAKCGKELCDDCTCEDNNTICKDCCGDGEKDDTEPEGCTGSCGHCQLHDEEADEDKE